MIHRTFQDMELPLLGFGTMRLPLQPDGITVDEALTAEMTAYALSHGVQYFDTAYPYHQGNSERVMGRVLSAYPRESYYLATKYPGHQIAGSYDPAAVFEEQLEKCGVDYFDFYLLHNVYENSIHTYMDPRWGIVDYFVEQKRLGRIRHLGFSTHGSVDVIRRFLDYCGDKMEFCQIQLNYLDWTLQDAKAKCALLNERNVPIWVMEPVRGGKLAQLPQDAADTLHRLRPEESTAAWAMRWLQSVPGVTMVLSGMSDMAQMQDNVRTFSQPRPLTQEEEATLLAIAEGLKVGVPCTACRYCCDGCPQGLDIPALLAIYNDLKFLPTFTVGMRVESLPEDKRPSACIGCGKCAQVCPQHIDIPGTMTHFQELLQSIPSWQEICRQREEAARKS